MANNNDVIRSLRYALDLPDAAIGQMIVLAGREADPDALARMVLNEDEAGYLDCDDATLAAFLDGLIIHLRGAREEPPAPMKRLNNNIIFKKIRIAFDLKEDDVLEIIRQAEFEISRPELSAIFRSPDNKNYRQCGDQLLRYFLKGLNIRLRG